MAIILLDDQSSRVLTRRSATLGLATACLAAPVIVRAGRARIGAWSSAAASRSHQHARVVDRDPSDARGAPDGLLLTLCAWRLEPCLSGFGEASWQDGWRRNNRTIPSPGDARNEHVATTTLIAAETGAILRQIL